jgi:type IV pilus assembly protein PilV
MITHGRNAARRQRGSILLDGMIAILIFSVGILGVLGFQAVAIKYTSNAKYRTDAAMYADQLLAQMWASAKNPALLSTFATGGTSYAPWKAQIVAALPGASANPPTVVFSGTQVTVTVSWNVASDAVVHQYTTVSQIVP